MSSTTTASAPKKVKFKKDFNVNATVTATGGATGTVQVLDGTKVIGTGTLVNGAVTIHITKNLKSGKHTLTVKYLGAGTVTASQTTVKVKVQRKRRRSTTTEPLTRLSSATGPVLRGRGRSSWFSLRCREGLRSCRAPAASRWRPGRCRC